MLRLFMCDTIFKKLQKILGWGRNATFPILNCAARDIEALGKIYLR